MELEAQNLGPQVSSPLPRHIAVVMDGNGRWARQRGLKRIEGHAEGRKATRRVVEECVRLGIEHLSLYAFSTENWSRSAEEVRGILTLIEMALEAELDDLHANNVRFITSGRTQDLPESLQRALAAGEARTAGNSGLVLNLALNYSGRTELADACRAIARDCVEGRLSAAEVTVEAVGRRLYRPELPDVDLFIRPGGEMRVSNFLLWQIAYAEIYVCSVLWPDFQAEHLHEAIAEFGRRERRFGGLPGSEQDSIGA
jgi:undecaprenyl diphosphate synthase